MNTNLLIIGDGLSTELFLYYFPSTLLNSYNFLIIEQKPDSNQSFGDDVPFYFNSILPGLTIKFDPVIISMGIYDHNIIYTMGSDELCIKYSKKIVDSISGNTIRFLEKEKKAYVLSQNDMQGRKELLYQYLKANNSEKKNIRYIFNCRILEVAEQFVIDDMGNQYNFDYLISTISLQSFVNISKLPFNLQSDLVNYPFYIRRFKLKSDKEYRVLYCTDENIRFSRIAKLDNTVFLESRVPIDYSELTTSEQGFLSLFNLLDYYQNAPVYPIYPGRFIQLSDEKYDMVTEYLCRKNIFLLGRMATWRFKLVEHIVKDSINIYEKLH